MTGVAGSWALHGFGMFSVIEKASGRWIGRVGPWRPEGWPGTEIGWGLLTGAQGQGYAVEAATASIDWAVDHLGWDDVIHTIDPANLASIGLAQRLGSTNRGPGRLPAPYEDRAIDVWGQSAAALAGASPILNRRPCHGPMRVRKRRVTMFSGQGSPIAVVTGGAASESDPELRRARLPQLPSLGPHQPGR